jgi:ribosomal protein S18 acetylase RimI-like enzyme
MVDKIIIRPADAGDAAGIERVARRTWNSTYANIILPENRQRLLDRFYSPAALEQAVAQNRSWFFVATQQEEIIGFAQFLAREEEEKSGELSRIYVLPEWQRVGVGGRLLGEGLAALAQEGVERILVAVEKDNLIGRRFYEKKGFRQAGEFLTELLEQKLCLVEYSLNMIHRAG